ncbi:hypothetical protein PTKU46_57930 [Paraburkholderia terrae]
MLRRHCPDQNYWGFRMVDKRHEEVKHFLNTSLTRRPDMLEFVKNDYANSMGSSYLCNF